jgi:hypothetical protein
MACTENTKAFKLNNNERLVIIDVVSKSDVTAILFSPSSP